MKEVLELIIKNLVENQEEVSISETLDKDVNVFTVKVNEKDMGKVIGKDGKTAKAIRTVIKSLANAERKKVAIHFAE